MDFELGNTYSKAFNVSKITHQGFIDLFDDNNPLHTNENFAVEKGFEGKVMHGNILNGYLSYFIGECLPTKNVIIHSQEIQFKKPVYMDDELNFEAVVSGVFESVGAVEFKFKFKKLDGNVCAKGKIQIGQLK